MIAAGFTIVLLAVATWAGLTEYEKQRHRKFHAQPQNRAKLLQLAQAHARCSAFYYLVYRKDIDPDQPLKLGKFGVRQFKDHAEIGLKFFGDQKKFTESMNDEARLLNQAVQAADTSHTLKSILKEIEAECFQTMRDTDLLIREYFGQ